MLLLHKGTLLLQFIYSLYMNDTLLIAHRADWIFPPPDCASLGYLVRSAVLNNTER